MVRKQEFGISAQEALRIMQFLERARVPFSSLGGNDGDSLQWNIYFHLFSAYFRGEGIGISRLIDLSKGTYGTAQRRVQQLISEGKIIKRPRPSSRKSFYLCPSEPARLEFLQYLSSVKTLIAETVGARDSGQVAEFYFGGANFAKEIMPPPPLQRALTEKGRELKFLLNNDNYFLAMRNMWADYRHSIASQKSFCLRTLPRLHGELKDALRAKPNSFDVVALNNPWLGEFASQDLLYPLDEFIVDSGLEPMDFHPAVWAAGTWGRHQYGVPIYVTVESLAIRRDLFEEDGISPPRTFDEVISIGKRLQNRDKGRFGIAWNAARGMPIASSFMILMGCCGAPILNIPRARRYHSWPDLSEEEMRPRINCSEAEAVLDYMSRLISISPPDILEMDWERRIASFISGESTMAYCWSMRAARFENDPESRVKKRTQLVPQPKGPMGISANPVGGFVLCIPKSSEAEEAKLAFQAIAWMASAEAMKKHVTNGMPVAPRFSVAADPEVAAVSPIVRYVDKLAQRGMLCTWQRPPIPAYHKLEAILGKRIHDAVSGELSHKEALCHAQNEADAMWRANL